MSEVNLSALAESGAPRKEKKVRTPMQEYEEALQACKFGKFHLRLFSTALTGAVTAALVSNTTAYLIPSAECDLHMDLRQKGVLNAIPYIGMLLSSTLAGFLTDTFGRKRFVLFGYGGIFVLTLIAGSSQTYGVLVAAKFFEGVFLATCWGPAVILVAEFCVQGIRDRVLLLQSSFVGVAQVLAALMSWAILSNDWKVTAFDGSFVLNTWNFYLYIMSLWSLCATVTYALLPESPKYLITQHKYDEARDILIRVYKENTGKPADTYAYQHIWKDEKKLENKTSFTNQMLTGCRNSKEMFKKPLVLYLMLICVIVLNTLMLFNVLRLWFPQLSTIIEHYNSNGTSGTSTDLCTMLDDYTDLLKISKKNNTAICVRKRSGTETYVNSIIFGVLSLIPYLISGVLVNRVGKKILTVGLCVLSTITTLGVRWSNSKPLIVGLFSMDAALNQTIVSMCQAVIIEIFPTSTRSLAVSMMLVAGRVGTLSGNIVFPILLEMGCAIPFYTFSAMMACVTVMSLFLPKKK